jgi:hypothetical protein
VRDDILLSPGGRGTSSILNRLRSRISEPSGDLEDLAQLPPEEREQRRSFEHKRKKHYNEFQAVKMARALMDEDESEVKTLEDENMT